MLCLWQFIFFPPRHQLLDDLLDLLRMMDDQEIVRALMWLMPRQSSSLYNVPFDTGARSPSNSRDEM